jgi:hypothetical protein
MLNTIINRSHRSLARIELSDEQIKVQAPSVFATTPQAGVSQRYTFLPTSQIVTRMRQEGWAPVEVQQQSVRLEGRMGFQKHVIRFQRRDQIAKPGEYAAEIALVNSHDRSSAYQIHTALYRFVCANGLMVSDSAFEPVSIRHSGRETEEVISASCYELIWHHSLGLIGIRAWWGCWPDWHLILWPNSPALIIAM